MKKLILILLILCLPSLSLAQTRITLQSGGEDYEEGTELGTSTNPIKVSCSNCGGGGSGDITSVGDVTSGAAFDGTQGSTLTFNNAGGDATQIYDGTDMTFNNAGVDIDSGEAYKYNSVNVIRAQTALYNYYFAGSGNLTGTGTSNIAIGPDCFPINTTGDNNVAMGNSTLFKNTTGDMNTAVGLAVLRNNTFGDENSAFGDSAMYNNTIGGYNTAVGASSLYDNFDGEYNTSVGVYAMASGASGTYNSALGTHALSYSDGDYNSAVGAHALGNGATSYTSAFGAFAGEQTTANAVNTLNTNSLFLGASTTSLTSSDDNTIVIGYDAEGAGSNSVVLGNSSITKTILRANVGIGDSTPASPLTVGDTDLFQVNSSGDIIRIDNVTYNWPGSQGAASTVLTNDGTGVLSWSAAGAGDITDVGDVASGAAFTGTQGNTLIFEGSTADTNEITVVGADPAADFTITIPAVTGTLLTADGVGTALTALNGENIQDDTIDDDSIDFADVTGADITLTDAVAVTTSGKIISNGNLDVKNGATSSGVFAIFEDSDDGTNKATFQVPALAGDTVYTLPADDGDSGEQLQTNGSGTLSWEAAGSGSGGSTTIPLNIYSAKITGSYVTATITNLDAATQGAAIDAGDGNWRVLFDATTDEAIVFYTILPSNYVSTPVVKIIYSMVSGTANEVEWEAAVQCTTPADAEDIGVETFADGATAVETVPGTVGYTDTVVSITPTDDSCAAGDIIYIYISTDANDATSDDSTGDRELVGVYLSFT